MNRSLKIFGLVLLVVLTSILTAALTAFRLGRYDLANELAGLLGNFFGTFIWGVPLFFAGFRVAICGPAMKKIGTELCANFAIPTLWELMEQGADASKPPTHSLWQ